MNNRAIICVAAALMAAFLAHSAPRSHSIENGTLHGIVTDSSGAVIPGALVVVSSGDFVKSASTDEAGQYTFRGLAPGHYRVHIHATGFSIFGRSGLVLSAGYETEADAQLTINPSRQVVTVAPSRSSK
jgi:protocatechuate 3,4-dioxygenase beta subunit